MDDEDEVGNGDEEPPLVLLVEVADVEDDIGDNILLLLLELMLLLLMLAPGRVPKNDTPVVEEDSFSLANDEDDIPLGPYVEELVGGSTVKTAGEEFEGGERDELLVGLPNVLLLDSSGGLLVEEMETYIELLDATLDVRPFTTEDDVEIKEDKAVTEDEILALAIEILEVVLAASAVLERLVKVEDIELELPVSELVMFVVAAGEVAVFESDPAYEVTESEVRDRG